MLVFKTPLGAAAFIPWLWDLMLYQFSLFLAGFKLVYSMTKSETAESFEGIRKKTTNLQKS